jgi:hypothetical protein
MQPTSYSKELSEGAHAVWHAFDVQAEVPEEDEMSGALGGGRPLVRGSLAGGPPLLLL